MIRLAVLSGLSGSGKTLALRCLEDMGCFAVDNLPVALIEPFVDLLDRSEDQEPRGAFVVDARVREHLEAVPAIIGTLRARADVRLTVLFLDAADSVLIRRYSETRRPHPLVGEGAMGVGEAIQRERELLLSLRTLADRVLDTDVLSPHDLRREIREVLSEEATPASLHCQLVSFGFKYGVPRDFDMVFDARFIENPYFVPALRTLTGKDPEILKFLAGKPDYTEFVERLHDLLSFVMPRFVHEGKSYLTIAIGCTGGRHRSVAIAEDLGRFLGQAGYSAAVVHRDLERKARQEQQ